MPKTNRQALAFATCVATGAIVLALWIHIHSLLTPVYATISMIIFAFVIGYVSWHVVGKRAAFKYYTIKILFAILVAWTTLSVLPISILVFKHFNDTPLPSVVKFIQLSGMYWLFYPFLYFMTGGWIVFVFSIAGSCWIVHKIR